MRRIALLIGGVVLTACSSDRPVDAYFRLDRVDSLAVPVDIEVTQAGCCPMVVDSGSLHVVSDNELHRTLHLTAWQVTPADTYPISTTHLVYSGQYRRQGNLLIITYPDSIAIGIRGADTAALSGDSLTITLRPTAGWARHLLHYAPVPRFCDVLTGPCPSQ